MKAFSQWEIAAEGMIVLKALETNWSKRNTPETTVLSTSWRRSARDHWKISQTEAKELKECIDWQVANPKEFDQPDEIKSRVDFD